MNEATLRRIIRDTTHRLVVGRVKIAPLSLAEIFADVILTIAGMPNSTSDRALLASELLPEILECMPCLPN